MLPSIGMIRYFATVQVLGAYLINKARRTRISLKSPMDFIIRMGAVIKRLKQEEILIQGSFL